MYLDYGFQDYLTKPIVGSSLEKLLYNWLPKWLIVNVKDKAHNEESAELQSGNSWNENFTVKESFDTSACGTTEVADFIKEVVSPSNSNVSVRKWPEEMDLERAMQYSFDGEEGLLFNVGLYLDNVDTMRANIVKAYEDKDFPNYAVYVHGLKSTSATVGLTELSELALKLEKAGKSGDNQVIIDNHDKVIAMYDEIVGKLREVCS